MNTEEIFKRLKIGGAIVVGFFAGKFAAGLGGSHASEFFIGGFGLGVILTQGAFWMYDKLTGKEPPF
jgi:hypothetical protein